MLLSKIMTGFHHCNRRWVCQFDRDTEIYSFDFLSNSTRFESGILYFGKISDLPEQLPALPLNFLCLEDAPLPSWYLNGAPSQLNLITLENSISSTQILQTLTSLFGNAARIAGGRSHLLEVLHANLGL